MKRLLLFGAVVLLMTSCATDVDVNACVNTGESVGGFWWGLWNGFTMFFSLIGSIFSDDITIYDVNNNGGWYNFGFWLGAAGFGGGASSSAKSRK
jgi:hypothetical protein